MRIRSTKPEFWRSARIAAMDLTVVYDGPFPTGPRAYATHLPGVAPNAEYVYLLFNDMDQLVYVGRAWRPADRFTKHRRKAWWPEVANLALVRVQGTSPDGATALTKLLEALAIRDLAPRSNIAGPSREALR